MIKARENPFRTEQMHKVVYRPLDTTWDALWERLARLDFRAAVLGPHGSGKSTLLDTLEPRLVEAGFRTRRVFVNRETPTVTTAHVRGMFAGLGRRDAVLLDGADHIGWLPWRVALRHSRAIGGLVVTSHARVLLPVLTTCRTTPELLRQIVCELTDTTTGQQPMPDCDDLWVRHRGNVRDAIRELYDKAGA